MSDRSDADVITSVLAGHSEEFGELVARHRDSQFRFAVRMLGDPDDADDALQASFVRAYRALASCRHPERFGVWLRQIVVNQCRTLATARSRRELTLVRDEVALDRLAESAIPGPDLDLEEMERALGELSSELREAFLLKHVEDHSYDEMMMITGAGRSALKMRVKRACAELQSRLEGVRDA